MRSLSALLLWLFAAYSLSAQPAPPASQQFQANIAHYLNVTKTVRSKVKSSSSIDKIHQQRLQLADGIRQARAGAKQGELFTPPIAAMFTQVLAATFAGPHGKRIRASLRHAEPVHAGDLTTNDLTIDAKYPDTVPLQSTPPTLLMNLPPLPKGIEYRIVGRTLVLRDAGADIIIDYLPAALPAAAGKSR